jgi:DNA mismatch repair ATPase MutS
MRNEQLEKTIVKMNNDIAAINIAKKYLSNVEEINEVRDSLNNKKQLLSNELYAEDHKSYSECQEFIEELLDKELGKDDQLKLLEMIKETFGRQYPNVSKKSNGLNAWLKELNLEYNWINDEETDWDKLIITGFGLYKVTETN